MALPHTTDYTGETYGVSYEYKLLGAGPTSPYQRGAVQIAGESLEEVVTAAATLIPHLNPQVDPTTLRNYSVVRTGTDDAVLGVVVDGGASPTPPAAPVITPAPSGGAETYPLSVTITGETGSTLHYTEGTGAIVTLSSPATFSLAAAGTVSAIAEKGGLVSPIETAVYA